MNILINSKELDKKLQIVLNKIVDYKINKKVLENSKIYSDDINDFLYDLEVSVKEA